MPEFVRGILPAAPWSVNARAFGSPNLPLVVPLHPLETRPAAEVHAITEGPLPGMVCLLTDRDPPAETTPPMREGAGYRSAWPLARRG
jgi:hypothetical protein